MAEEDWLQSFKAELKEKLDAVMQDMDDPICRDFIVQHTAFVPNTDCGYMYIDGQDVYIPSQEWLIVFPGCGRDEALVDADVQEAKETKVKLESIKYLYTAYLFTTYLDHREKSIYAGDPREWIIYAADIYEHTPKKYTGVAYTRSCATGWSIIKIKTELPDQIM